MAYTIGNFGVASLLTLGRLMACVYATMALFIFVVLNLIARLLRASACSGCLAYIKDEILIVLGTVVERGGAAADARQAGALRLRPAGRGAGDPGRATRSTSTARRSTSRWRRCSSRRRTASTSRSASSSACSAVLMVTSKGAAGVTGSGFIVLASTLSALRVVPVEGVALVLGVDRFMSEARAITNLIGNAVATVVIAKSEGAFTSTAAAARIDSGARSRRATATIPGGADPTHPADHSLERPCARLHHLALLPAPRRPRRAGRSRPPNTPPAATRWRRGSTAASSSPSARPPPTGVGPPGQLPAFRYLTGFLEPDAALVLVVRGGRADRHAVHRRRATRAGHCTTASRPIRPPSPARPACRRALDRGAGARARFAGRDRAPVLHPARLQRRRLRRDRLADPRRQLPAGVPGGASRARGARRPPHRRQPARAEEPGRAGAAPPGDRRHGRRAARGACAPCGPAVYEYEIEALFASAFRRTGGDGPAFGSIVGSGPNSTQYHYDGQRSADAGGRRRGDGRRSGLAGLRRGRHAHGPGERPVHRRPARRSTRSCATRRRRRSGWPGLARRMRPGATRRAPSSPAAWRGSA